VLCLSQRRFSLKHLARVSVNIRLKRALLNKRVLKLVLGYLKRFSFCFLRLLVFEKYFLGDQVVNYRDNFLCILDLEGEGKDTGDYEERGNFRVTWGNSQGSFRRDVGKFMHMVVQ